MNITFDLQKPQKNALGSSVSEVIEEIRKFSFCSALNELYFAVWVSPVVQSSSPVLHHGLHPSSNNNMQSGNLGGETSVCI